MFFHPYVLSDSNQTLKVGHHWTAIALSWRQKHCSPQGQLVRVKMAPSLRRSVFIFPGAKTIFYFFSLFAFIVSFSPNSHGGYKISQIQAPIPQPSVLRLGWLPDFPSPPLLTVLFPGAGSAYFGGRGGAHILVIPTKGQMGGNFSHFHITKSDYILL